MITLFTGAGASRPFGYPTTPEFFSGKSATTLHLVKHKVYQNLKTHFAQGTLDVEDVLRTLQPFADLKDIPTGKFLFPHFQGRWYQEIPSFITLVNRACFELYGRTPARGEVDKVYRPVLDRLGWGAERVNLFTTNYDPVTDQLLRIADESGVNCTDGFTRFGIMNSKEYSEIVAGLSIYRLHGSMSWIEKDGEVQNSRDCDQRARGLSSHLLIYPGFKGNPEENRNSPFAFAHSALRSSLQRSRFGFVTGFSFRDPHLNEIFDEALRENKRFKLVIWNPEFPVGPETGATKLKERFSEQVLHLPYKFGSDEAIHELDKILA